MTILAFAGNAIQLVPDGTLLLHLVLIVVMVGLLNLTLLKPINRILNERERRTKGRLGEAQALLAIVNEKMEAYERGLREARASGYQQLEVERGAASQERERRVAEFQIEITGWRQKEIADLRAEEEKVKASLTTDARALASEISGRILGRPVK